MPDRNVWASSANVRECKAAWNLKLVSHSLYSLAEGVPDLGQACPGRAEKDLQRQASHRGSRLTKKSFSPQKLFLETRSWAATFLSFLHLPALPMLLPSARADSAGALILPRQHSFLSWSERGSVNSQRPPLSQHKPLPLAWWKVSLSGNSCC